MPALVRLNFLRAAVAVAAVIGFAGASLVAGFASPANNPQPGLAFFLFLPLAALICWVWWALNWLLSLAGMFAVRDGEDAVGAISAAVAFCRERTGAVFAVSTWTGLAHLVAFVGATCSRLDAAGLCGPRAVATVGVAEWVRDRGVFRVADWLYMARLAGYVCIAETPEALLRPLPPAAASASTRRGAAAPDHDRPRRADPERPIQSKVRSGGRAWREKSQIQRVTKRSERQSPFWESRLLYTLSPNLRNSFVETKSPHNPISLGQ